MRIRKTSQPLLGCSVAATARRKSGATGMASDVPPVPPLPAKYANNKFASYRTQGDVEMEDDDSSDDEQHPGRIDEADEGMFGKMD